MKSTSGPALTAEQHRQQADAFRSWWKRNAPNRPTAFAFRYWANSKQLRPADRWAIWGQVGENLSQAGHDDYD